MLSVIITVRCKKCGAEDKEWLAIGRIVPVPLFNCVCGNDQYAEVIELK